MSPSPEPLLTIWTDLNRRYFQGTLPPIPIEWSRRLTSSAGMFVCRIGPRQPLTRTTEAPTRRRCIRLSAVLLKPNNPEPSHETVMTLAHEMIHQWQYDILKRRPNHGADFRRMMDQMNRDGLGITIYHSLGKEVAALGQICLALPALRLPLSTTTPDHPTETPLLRRLSGAAPRTACPGTRLHCGTGPQIFRRSSARLSLHHRVGPRCPDDGPDKFSSATSTPCLPLLPFSLIHR
jgi:hypothetical protein